MKDLKKVWEKENEEFETPIIECENLYDKLKLRLLKVAFDKYSLEQLQERLEIKNNEY